MSVLLGCRRIGINNNRAVSATSWPPLSRDAVDSLSSNKVPCSIERYTYKSEGEPSRFRVLHPNNRRSLTYRSNIYPSRISPQYHSRGAFRLTSSDKYLCQNCKKSFVSPTHTDASTSSLDRCSSTTTAHTNKHDERYVDSHTDVKISTNSVKRRRAEDGDKIKHVKPKRSRHAEAPPSVLPSPFKKEADVAHLGPAVSDAIAQISVKKQKDAVPTTVPSANSLKQLSEHITSRVSEWMADCSSPSNSAPLKSSHEKPKHREHKNAKSKRTSQTRSSSASNEMTVSSFNTNVLEKLETEKSVLPPIILKLNRSDQRGSSDEPAEYKVSQIIYTRCNFTIQISSCVIAELVFDCFDSGKLYCSN